MTFQSITPSIPEILSPPLSPPGVTRGPQRNLAKSSALKLITSFGEQSSKSKYFSAADGGQTPMAAGVTPIAESAISPGGYDPATAFLRPSNNSAFNTPSSARVGAGVSFGRHRLPSIGETTADGVAHRLAADKAVNTLPPPTERPPSRSRRDHSAYVDDNLASGMSLPRAATASPMMMRDSHRKKEPPPPSPSPASMAALMDASGRHSRNGPRNRIPEGIDMHLGLPSVDDGVADYTSPEPSVASSTRFHWPRPTRRRGPGSITSSVTSESSISRSHRDRGRHAGGKSLDDYIYSLDAAKNRPPHGASGDRHRDGSRSHRGGSRERSSERGRAVSRRQTPKPAKRSPTSPVPMSPEDLINLSTPKVIEIGARADEILVDILTEEYEPSTVRKSSQVRQTSRNRVSSRNSSRHGRRRSPDRRPTPQEDPRGRSKAREGSVIRSPSSPLPMSTNAQFYYGSEDEEDYRKAIEAKEKFRSQNGRSSSHARERSESRRRGGPRDSPENRVHTPGAQQQSTSSEREDRVGDLKQKKDERTLKKEAAARELEERRKSLAMRALAPAILHPDELSPAFELPSTAFVPPKDLPTRSHTVEPGATRSTYANRSGPAIGLPATPKAMRLVMDADPNGVPGVPSIPSTFAQRHSPSSGSPKRESKPPSLTLLPSTVYSPPSRPHISRSMSAPPEEPEVPRTLLGGSGSGSSSGNSSRSHALKLSQRKPSTPDAYDGQSMQNIDALIDSNRQARRPSIQDNNSNNNMPPPPPPPPVLKELQHLATPPPPPPAPLSYAHGDRPVVYGGQTSGMIEIVRDDDQQQQPPPVPVAIPVSEATVPIIAPPAPPSSRNGHHRGRSSIDNSISGRISRATERMRSASRSRNTPSVVNRAKSPEVMAGVAPYESIPPPPPPPLQPQQYHHQGRGSLSQQSGQLAHHPDMRTGLHESEMI